jgi:hypothetical protein
VATDPPEYSHPEEPGEDFPEDAPPQLDEAYTELAEAYLPKDVPPF